ncbi:hypothetical protein [Mycobacteroides abscessus]|uniref:hypothetical protein n=1 Tax=Mycobacteroides abscessus TaxID=36809 RepID=UPI00078B88F4|nr:hypothetical protein [Mycobacteroides abscessus]AMU20862.1 hypothetical protein A3N95_08620 [Mycobacteroides abscessus]
MSELTEDRIREIVREEMLGGQPLGEYPEAELRQVFVFSPLQVQGWIAHMRDETDRWIHRD